MDKLSKCCSLYIKVTTTQAMICEELVRFHKFLQLTAEASLEWSSMKASREIGVTAISNMLLLNYVAPLERSNVVAKICSIVLHLDSEFTSTLLSLFKISVK